MLKITLLGKPSGVAVEAQLSPLLTSSSSLLLGDQAYESLAREGETMTITAMVTYAYDQIDQARTELNAVSK